MTMPARESTAQALYARLTAALTGLKFTSRAYLDPDDVPAGQQPCLLLLTKSGHVERSSPGLPWRWRMFALVIIYVRVTQPAKDSAAPETALHGYLDQIAAALTRQANEVTMFGGFGTTLGGLVWDCSPVDYQIHHGAGAEQAALTVTLEIVGHEVQQ
jgi:hypothetical protein